MGNLIRADMYRLRKGATIRYTLLGVLAIILIIGLTMFAAGHITDETPISESTAESQRADGVGVVVSDIMEASTAVGFTREMLAQNAMAFLLLPLFIAVFADDYNNGAYRNLLSFETNRKKIYAAKLALSFLLTLAMLLAYFVLSALFGGILFGFGGLLSATFWVRSLVSMLLTAPLYLAYIAFGHMVTAFARKSSITIAVYLVQLLIWSTLITVVAGFVPGFEWLTLLDFLSGISFLSYYWVLPTWGIFSYIGLGLGAAALCTVIGMRRYSTADMP